jgi:hypothetical protein
MGIGSAFTTVTPHAVATTGGRTRAAWLDRATQEDPGHVQARCWTGILHCIHGRTDQALALREIDPLGPYPYAMTGLCLLQAQRPEDADPFLDQARVRR